MPLGIKNVSIDLQSVLIAFVVDVDQKENRLHWCHKVHSWAYM